MKLTASFLLSTAIAAPLTLPSPNVLFLARLSFPPDNACIAAKSLIEFVLIGSTRILFFCDVGSDHSVGTY